jgi:hypothetical protein
MSTPSVGAEAGRSCDADVLAEVSTMLQDCACLHYALTELIGDAQKKAVAAQSSAHFTVLSAQLRVHSAKLGVVSSIRDAERAVLSHHAAALQALACADQANALHHIALCDAEALRLIGQRCTLAGMSAETRATLLMVHRILRQASLKGSLAKGPARRSP